MEGGAWMDGWAGGGGAGWRVAVAGWWDVWRDRTANPTAQTQLQQEPNRNRSKPVPETETNRNEPWLYWGLGFRVITITRLWGILHQ